MVLLHHEVELEFPDGQPAESHRATLLEFGRPKDGNMTSAMALTVGIPVAIGALVRALLHGPDIDYIVLSVIFPATWIFPAAPAQEQSEDHRHLKAPGARSLYSW